MYLHVKQNLPVFGPISDFIYVLRFHAVEGHKFIVSLLIDLLDEDFVRDLLLIGPSKLALTRLY